MKEMSRWALVAAPETTLTAMETDAAAPSESVTVRVRTWTPREEGAVQEVVAALGSEKVPLVAVQAQVRVSPALGSCAVALRGRVPPAWTEVGDATTESMRGGLIVAGRRWRRLLKSDRDGRGLVGGDGDVGNPPLEVKGAGGVEGLDEEGAVGTGGNVADEPAPGAAGLSQVGDEG
ncbi:MAG TPA: hypothetical protein VEU33_23000 [Archangium sp.]|nr:hypothetical protein [Archangium sp.]